jgi:N-acetylglucosaminyl-diphospho-decaprenol L-rhamnosyltransferase
MASLPSLARPRLDRRKTPAVIRPQPCLSAVIVNYRQWENTAALVQQVRSTPCARRGHVEVMVVDNHSPPHRLMRRLRRWPEVSLRRWGRNRGFARAVNEGCRLSRSQWFLLLNPDVQVTAEFIQGVLDLASRLETTEPDTGIVGFRLHNADGSEQLSCGSFPTLAGTLARLTLPRARRKYRTVSASERCPVPWVTGCCLLVRGDCWRELGGFDEEFFLYYEDVDLCRRAWANGWSVWHEPQLTAVHHSPLHGRTVPASLRLVLRHSLLTYAARHWRPLEFRMLARVIRVESWARRLWAWWRKDAGAYAVFQELSCLAADLGNGARGKARSRLHRAVRAREQAAPCGLGSPVPA